MPHRPSHDALLLDTQREDGGSQTSFLIQATHPHPLWTQTEVEAEQGRAGGAFCEYAFQRAPRFCKTEEQQLNKDIGGFKPEPFKFGRLFLKIQTFLFQNTLGASGFGSARALPSSATH